jgi:translation initiation factor IF-2
VSHSKTIATAVAVVLGAALPMMSAQAAQYTKQEKEAIAAVQGFYDALNARDAAGGESKMPIRPIVEKYIAPNYHQNNPGMAAGGQGPEALIRMFGGGGGAPRGGAPGGAGPNAGGAPPGAGTPPAGGPPARGPGVDGKAPKVRYIGAVGNLVIRVSEVGTSGMGFNMFTVENGKLVEHWDAVMGGGGGGGGRQGGGRQGGGPPGGPGGPPGAGGPPDGFPAGGPPGAGGPPPGGR